MDYTDLQAGRDEFIESMSSSTVVRECLSLLLGAKLGNGTTRAVFEHATDESMVVKISTVDGVHCNVAEFELSGHLRGSELEKWIAPVEWMSPHGRAVIQRRTVPITKRRLPSKVPAFFTDTKPSNWGLIKGRPVCHDYGYHRALAVGCTNRMRKADWSGET